MLNNYQYFIAIAEERNLSRAADRLYISHQCLSKYLKNLEQEYGVSFFERTPGFSLTPAGNAYLEMARNLALLEHNLGDQLEMIRKSEKGVLRFGTTEGRYRILIPHFLTEFKKHYPGVTLETISGTSEQLCEAVLENRLDLALVNEHASPDPRLQKRPVLQEQLYLVISDNMLKTYFPKDYPQCKERFAKGINLREFSHVPLVLGQPALNMRKRLEEHFRDRGLTPLIAAEIGQTDLQYMLTARDYAAAFCWSMYLPSIRKENLNPGQSELYAFPLKNAKISNSLILVSRKGKIFQEFGRDFIKMVKSTCLEYAGYSAD